MSYPSSRPVNSGQQDTRDTSFPNQSSIRKKKRIGNPCFGSGKIKGSENREVLHNIASYIYETMMVKTMKRVH